MSTALNKTTNGAFNLSSLLTNNNVSTFDTQDGGDQSRNASRLNTTMFKQNKTDRLKASTTAPSRHTFYTSNNNFGQTNYISFGSCVDDLINEKFNSKLPKNISYVKADKMAMTTNGPFMDSKDDHEREMVKRQKVIHMTQ